MERKMINIVNTDITYPELNRNPRILLGPGPSMVHPRVTSAMTAPMIGHLDPCFLQLMDKTQELLRYVFQTKNRVTIPISGTGSAGMEASLANFIEDGTPVLVCTNGFFGNRLVEMAERYRADLSVLRCPWGKAFTLDEIAEELKRKPAKVVAIVHAETSTGVLQPLEGLADIVHDQGGILVVDAVTSLTGINIPVDELGIDVCYSGTQKCLGVPPGLAPFTVSERAIEVIRNRKTKVSSWYLDLSIINAYWGKDRSYHHTAPVSMNYALYEGLRMVWEERLENRWARHAENARLFWDGLEEIGLKPFIPEAQRLTTLTTVKIPSGVNDLEIRNQLLKVYNIEIAGGIGDLKGEIWRIGLMGYSSRKENLLLLLAAFKKLLNR